MAVLAVLTTGKESWVRANAVLQMTEMIGKTLSEPVEFLALGPGVEIFRANQKNSPQVGEMLTQMRATGITLAVCELSLTSLGLTRDQMFEAKVVRGGVEVAQRIQEGYVVLTF